jgi:glyoxylase-like metal-dependent hydrolase (beta-lactamase superfamily II)
VNELAPGLWHWTARHPEWTDEDDAAQHGWGPEVSSYAVRCGDQLVLIDPVLPPDGLAGLPGIADAVVVLTCPWHLRDAPSLGRPVWAPPPEGPRDWPAHEFHAGETLPFGMRAYEGLEPVDLVLWIESHGALVFGDTLIDRGRGLELPDNWGPAGADHAAVLAALRPCLELGVRFALPTHGPPGDAAALACALAEA